MVAAIDPLVRWRDGVEAHTDSLTVAGHRLPVGAALAQVLARPVPLSEAIDIVGMERLDRLHAGRMLTWVLPCGELTAQQRDLPLPRFEPRDPAELSRFALVRREGDRAVIESGRSPWVLVTDAQTGADAIAGRGSECLWGVLTAAGMVDSDDLDAAATAWLFHDRLFAQRSRADWIAPLAPRERDGAPSAEPAHRIPPSAAGACIALTVPTTTSDLPLARAIEERRTPRAWGSAPVTLQDLGLLLWWTLRVQSAGLSDTRKLDGIEVPAYQTWQRPVPSAGAIHGIDTWLYARDVEGLAPGWYWYDPLAHCLAGVPGGIEPAQLDTAVLGVLTARHARYAWKYSGFAHALELKDAGVILHALQLSSALVDLGACPIGTGRTEFYARALGIDPEQDMPVGEFQVGTLP